MNKIKIAYCIPALYTSGGMERVLSIKANYLAELSYEVHIIITDGKNKEPFYKLHSKISVHQLDINYNELYNLPLYKRIISYSYKQRLFKKRLDATLCQIKPDITISLLRRDINFINKMKDGSRKIGEIHFSKSNYRKFEHRIIPVFIQKLINAIWMKQLIFHLKKLDKFIVLSHEDKKEWIELNNTEVIYNPLSFYPDEQSTCENKQVIAIGRHVPLKGFDLLIKAWGIVSPIYPEWKLKIIGEGDVDYLLENILALKIKDTCILEKRTPNIQKELIESSILVLSSRYEGLPMVLLESMSCGVPPVSFTCPCGPRDIITDEIDGLLVENGNIKELASKISHLIKNDCIRKEMGRKARISSKRFLPEKIMQKWISLFESIIKDKDA